MTYNVSLPDSWTEKGFPYNTDAVYWWGVIATLGFLHLTIKRIRPNLQCTVHVITVWQRSVSDWTENFHSFYQNKLSLSIRCHYEAYN